MEEAKKSPADYCANYNSQRKALETLADNWAKSRGLKNYRVKFYVTFWRACVEVKTEKGYMNVKSFTTEDLQR